MLALRAVLAFTAILVSGTSFAEKRVLGKLGQATEATPIYATANVKSKVYYRVKQYEYLVISEAPKNNWMKVLLKNGRYGYVVAETIAKLPYEVTADMSPRSGAGSMRDLGSGGSRGAAVDNGLRYIGTPYVWGGNDLRGGIDCSGFVKQLYGQEGLSLPRTASEQALVGQPITRLENLQKGDRLYFWEKKRNKIGHTGIYMGNGYFVHSSRGHNGVATDYLGQPKWLRILVAARR